MTTGIDIPAPPLAHLGHWYVSLPIFMGPVLLISLALKIQTWRERHKGADTTGKRSVLTVTENDPTTTIAIAGPLDYPAVVELETALGTLAPQIRAITIDLRKTAGADQEAAWSLCDAICRSRGTDSVTVLIDPSTIHAKTLADTLTSEGIAVSRERGSAAWEANGLA